MMMNKREKEFVTEFFSFLFAFVYIGFMLSIMLSESISDWLIIPMFILMPFVIIIIKRINR